MMWRTHALFGMASLWLLAPLPTLLTRDTIGPLVTLAAFGALLPDLDAGESKIKSLKVGGIQPFVPASQFAYRTWGHRGRLHAPSSLLVVGMLALPLAFAWGTAPALALWLGYASHLVADACTRSGIPRYARHSELRLHLLPQRLRFVTGSLAEERLLPLLALAVLLLLLTRFPLV